MSTPSKVELLLCYNDSSQLALSIPLAECTTFAITPLKWLRFLGFIIYGQRGYLSTSMNGPELDYTAQLEARSYYFISDGEPRFADVDAMDNRASSASDLSIGRLDFKQKLIKRDGTCVFTGDLAAYCNACHFIPHSKGDNYMSNFFNYRHELYGVVDPLDNVNDTRNGILLSDGFHSRLDVGVIAFLKTPNFALTVDDIPYHQPPNAVSPANRFTLQHIRPSEIGSLSLLGPHNSDARLPQDISQWPPSIIVDLCYSAAVLRAWGPKPFIEYMRANSKDSYYQSGDDDEDEDAQGDSTRQTSDRYDRRCAKKAQAVNLSDQPTFEDTDMFDLVLALWMRAAREAQKRPPGRDVTHNENKIQTWLQSIEEPTL